MLVEHFVIKSALTVSTPNVLLAFIPSKAGCSALMMWKVRSHVDLPLLAVTATWPIGLTWWTSIGQYYSLRWRNLGARYVGEVVGRQGIAGSCRIYLERNLLTDGGV